MKFKKIENAWETLLNMLFPRRCPVCDRIVSVSGLRVCPECRKEFRRLREPLCRKCGKALWDETQEYCDDCRKRKHYFDEGAALYEYASVRESNLTLATLTGTHSTTGRQ